MNSLLLLSLELLICHVTSPRASHQPPSVTSRSLQPRKQVKGGGSGQKAFRGRRLASDLLDRLSFVNTLALAHSSRIWGSKSL